LWSEMAVPSITSVTPSSGPTGGSLLIEIDGAGFRLPDPPGATGPTLAPAASVRITVGGRPARDVRVYAGDRLTCIVPEGDAGAADVGRVGDSKGVVERSRRPGTGFRAGGIRWLADPAVQFWPTAGKSA